MKNFTLLLLSILLLIIGCTPQTEEDVIYDIPSDSIYDELVDFNTTDKPLWAETIGNGFFWVYQPIANDKYIGHNFIKNTYDDFIMYSSIVIGSMDNNNFVPETYLSAGSNKEFAFRAKPANSDADFVWFPEHEGVGSGFQESQTLMFDGEEQDLLTASGLIAVETVELIQEINFEHPASDDPLAHLNIKSIIDINGVTFDSEITWLEDSEIDRGYIAMLPIATDLLSSLRTSNDEIISLDNSGNVDLTDSHEINEFTFLSNPDDNDYQTALTEVIHNQVESLRLDLDGLREPEIIWLENRSAEIYKVYPQVYFEYFAEQGETYQFSSTIFAGLFSTN